MIQLFDVYGFRIWKNFVRTFSGRALNYDIYLHLRNNIIKLQSLTHIHKLFKYVWFKSGYIEKWPSQFENLVDFCFSRKDIQEISRCFIYNTPTIIRCSWCKKYFCMHHFFEEYHDCKHYEI